ncbi:heme o synthase [Piscirickettsia litoralis]|uniref:heme o synthase n=1 Tax=Piscirickettsia litoralis TaxID=1891921 RepID=UPI000B24B303|nr:heme o synthase [Piscirickettsia litoralis]
MSLVVACGCILNNYIDRDIDKLMERTKRRISAQGLISGKFSVLYASVLGILGSLILYFQTNLLTVITAFIGLFAYVILYTLWFKRSSVYGTTIGGIAGAIPPVAGYCAATNRFDSGAVILFAILFFWQMPHFYAIAIYRLKDYTAAKIPVLPIKKGIYYTKISMLVHIFAFTIVAAMPFLFGYTGFFYFLDAFTLGLIWFYFGLKGFSSNDKKASAQGGALLKDVTWARKMFIFSVVNITLLSVMMSIL